MSTPRHTRCLRRELPLIVPRLGPTLLIVEFVRLPFKLNFVFFVIEPRFCNSGHKTSPKIHKYSKLQSISTNNERQFCIVQLPVNRQVHLNMIELLYLNGIKCLLLTDNGHNSIRFVAFHFTQLGLTFTKPALRGHKSKQIQNNNISGGINGESSILNHERSL